MKKTIFTTIITTLLLCACQNNTSAQKKTGDEQIPNDSIVQRVTDIYTHVCASYPNDHGMDENFNFTPFERPNLDSLYCSAHWNELLAAVEEKDEQSGDELPFFDYDYWIMGQDWDKLRFDSVAVVEVKDKTATVTLNLYNFDTCNHLTLTLVRERNNWFIDNILNDYSGYDIDIEPTGIREDMEEYIQQDN